MWRAGMALMVAVTSSAMIQLAGLLGLASVGSQYALPVSLSKCPCPA